jgi:hypothetical protein
MSLAKENFCFFIPYVECSWCLSYDIHIFVKCLVAANSVKLDISGFFTFPSLN